MKASHSSQPVIEVNHLRTQFGPKVVHEDVNLTVRQEEIFALVGGSGSGKSVLLREIIQLQQPSAGSIRVFGAETARMTSVELAVLRRRWGVLFQQGALFSALTVAENVAAPLREHTRLSDPFICELALVKIVLAGLAPEAATRYPRELSGGMRKRAAMARAIALDPELVFLDEPTAGLDPESANGLDELVLQLKDVLGLTVVIVTHDLDSLWRVADRVAVLGQGRVLEIGTMEELSRSDNPVTRTYFHGPRGRAARQAVWTHE